MNNKDSKFPISGVDPARMSAEALRQSLQACDHEVKPFSYRSVVRARAFVYAFINEHLESEQGALRHDRRHCLAQLKPALAGLEPATAKLTYRAAK